MLVKPSDIKIEVPEPVNPEESTQKQLPVALVTENSSVCFVGETQQVLTRSIGLIQNGYATHYYSWGNFNLVRLIIHLLKQTGPAHCMMTSYSFQPDEHRTSAEPHRAQRSALFPCADRQPCENDESEAFSDADG